MRLTGKYRDEARQPRTVVPARPVAFITAASTRAGEDRATAVLSVRIGLTPRRSSSGCSTGELQRAWRLRPRGRFADCPIENRWEPTEPAAGVCTSRGTRTPVARSGGARPTTGRSTCEGWDRKAHSLAAMVAIHHPISYASFTCQGRLARSLGRRVLLPRLNVCYYVCGPLGSRTPHTPLARRVLSR